jgi:hypothetical protein
VLGDVNLAKALSGVKRECSASLAWNSSLPVWLKLLICNGEGLDQFLRAKATRIRFFQANTGILHRIVQQDHILKLPTKIDAKIDDYNLQCPNINTSMDLRLIYRKAYQCTLLKGFHMT